jgi:hypothetical protein
MLGFNECTIFTKNTKNKNGIKDHFNDFDTFLF